MILIQEVTIRLTTNTIKYYESKGYFIPRSYTKWHPYKLSVIEGTTIVVQVKDLPQQSDVKVLCECDKCREKRYISYKYIKNPTTLCHCCSMSQKEVKEKLINNNGMNGKTGKNHPRWNPNLTNLQRQRGRIVFGIYYWKKLVKERDNYTCQCCGSKKQLEVHHIDCYEDFKEIRTLVDNGITLCFDCHRAKNGSLHNIYGKHPTRKDLEELLDKRNVKMFSLSCP